jgi:hypothetical protein
MTRVGWLVDEGGTVGGAEFTQAEFRAAAPAEVEVVDCPPGGIENCDRYVVQNCVTYRDLGDFRAMEGAPVTKYWHDVGPWLAPGVREWLNANARNVCCSPLQADHMRLADAELVPPPVDLQPFIDAAEGVNGERKGAVSIGSWRNHGKAPHRAAEWGAQHGGVTFFGNGPLAPPGCVEVPPAGMPAILSGFETFVFLPTVIEPFGRIVAEAWAAGCELVVNAHVGATHWLTEDPGAIDTAAIDFWDLVLAR